jgi:hypothetical protein
VGVHHDRGFIRELNNIEETCTVVSRIRVQGIRGEQSIYLKFIRAFFFKKSLQYHSFPVGHPGRVHNHTALRAVREISSKKGVCAHSLWLTVFTATIIFIGSDPRWLPALLVSRSEHVASELEGLLSLSPPYLQLIELSRLVSCERIRYPVGLWLRHIEYRYMGV